MTEPTSNSQSYQQHRQASREIAARCAILTLSDTRTPETDLSGQLARQLLEQAGHKIADYRLIKDDPAELAAMLRSWLDDKNIDAVITNGGTGISRRDQTIAVIEKTLETPLPGFGELFRMLSWQQIRSGAMLSRAVGGVSRGKLLFALPGSRAAVELALSQLIIPELSHLLHELRKNPS